jgi:hypothetical protein
MNVISWKIWKNQKQNLFSVRTIFAKGWEKRHIPGMTWNDNLYYFIEIRID